MGRIRVLPDTVINTIAAGEVVERPASVAKELIENALDAGAGSVVVRVEDGGRRLVEVLDDGCGMDADDAVAAFDRHATSKLAPDRPLELVETLGFRGEALPSIAAVSRLTLTTGTGREATRVEIEGGRILSAGPATHPAGTTVCVRDLFFNTPARRRFLRATSTETGHLLELFTALALSRPGVRFRLTHGNRRLFDLPPAEDLRSRLGQMEGPEAHRAAADLALEHGGIRISGFVLAGEASRQQRARRLIVNGRVVRD
ncbi:MAG TPA: DNA mismatch repair endonuclease MutL, partial [Candidatus Saccharimonadales bacterium]|nr:DNA mismatch repair endonuclease MutL [Candidatus Saccharimonadales bacterium]